MRSSLSLWMLWLVPWGSALLMVALGLRNQRQIERLREERITLVDAASAAGIPVGPEGRVVRVRTRERVDHQAEGRRIAAELAARAGAEADAAAGVKLVEDVLAMNSEQLREAIAYFGQAEGMEGYRRIAHLFYLIGRLAEHHPWETLVLLEDLNSKHPELAASIDRAADKAAEQLAVTDPDAALAYFQNRKNDLNERQLVSLRAAVLLGVVRVDPAAALRWAEEEGIDGTRFLVWDDQTADEKHAALAALRAWTEDQEVVRKTIGELALRKPHDGHISYEEVTGWVELAGLTTEEVSFFVRGIDLSYAIDPVETAQWLDWLVEKFPEDAVERQIERMREDHRTKGEVEKWLERRATR